MPQAIHALCAIHGASQFMPHGQFSFIRVARQKQLITVFDEAKPPEARRQPSRRLAEATADDYATVEGNPKYEQKDFAKTKSFCIENKLISSRTEVHDERP